MSRTSDMEDLFTVIINKLDSIPKPTRVASFDLDDTLIVLQRGKKDKSGITFVDDAITDKIKGLVKKKYIIVVFTNQAGMTVNKAFDMKTWESNVKLMIKKLFSKVTDPYYFALYAAKTYDLYRKPNIGMWIRMREDLAEIFGKTHISDKSFFVGDAAGRTVASPLIKRFHPSTKSDHSDTDRKFALNVKIKFQTPNEFFGDETPIPFVMSGFDPSKYLDEKLSSDSDSDVYEFIPRSKELIVIVGPPGSGKSEFVNKYIKPCGYVVISQDFYKTKKRCLDVATEAFIEGECVVIDNTNLDIISRMEYTTLALKNGYKHIRCIVIKVPIELAVHLNNVRHVYSQGLIPRIGRIAYATLRKKYVEPSRKEKFDKIEYVDFAFDSDKLNDPVWNRIFMMWSEA